MPLLNGLEPNHPSWISKVTYINLSLSNCAFEKVEAFFQGDQRGWACGLERLKNRWIVTHWNAWRAPSCKGMQRTVLASHTDPSWVFGWMKRMYEWISNELVPTLDSSFCACQLMIRLIKSPFSTIRHYVMFVSSRYSEEFTFHMIALVGGHASALNEHERCVSSSPGLLRWLDCNTSLVKLKPEPVAVLGADETTSFHSPDEPDLLAG